MANPNPIGLILPVKGVLYLFYDDLAERWGYDPIHRAVFKVLLFPSSQIRKPRRHLISFKTCDPAARST